MSVNIKESGAYKINPADKKPEDVIKHFEKLSMIKVVDGITKAEDTVFRNPLIKTIPKELVGAIVVKSIGSESNGKHKVVLIASNGSLHKIEEYAKNLKVLMEITEEGSEFSFAGITNDKFDTFCPGTACNFVGQPYRPRVYAFNEEGFEKIEEGIEGLKRKCIENIPEMTPKESASKPRDPNSPEYFN